jgi:hypothetical protein
MAKTKLTMLETNGSRVLKMLTITPPVSSLLRTATAMIRTTTVIL